MLNLRLIPSRYRIIQTIPPIYNKIIIPTILQRQLNTNSITRTRTRLTSIPLRNKTHPTHLQINLILQTHIPKFTQIIIPNPRSINRIIRIINRIRRILNILDTNNPRSKPIRTTHLTKNQIIINIPSRHIHPHQSQTKTSNIRPNIIRKSQIIPSTSHTNLILIITTINKPSIIRPNSSININIINNPRNNSIRHIHTTRPIKIKSIIPSSIQTIKTIILRPPQKNTRIKNTIRNIIRHNISRRKRRKINTITRITPNIIITQIIIKTSIQINPIPIIRTHTIIENNRTIHIIKINLVIKIQNNTTINRNILNIRNINPLRPTTIIPSNTKPKTIQNNIIHANIQTISPINRNRLINLINTTLIYITTPINNARRIISHRIHNIIKLNHTIHPQIKNIKTLIQPTQINLIPTLPRNILKTNNNILTLSNKNINRSIPLNTPSINRNILLRTQIFLKPNPNKLSITNNLTPSPIPLPHFIINIRNKITIRIQMLSLSNINNLIKLRRQMRNNPLNIINKPILIKIISNIIHLLPRNIRTILQQTNNIIFIILKPKQSKPIIPHRHIPINQSIRQNIRIVQLTQSTNNNPFSPLNINLTSKRRLRIILNSNLLSLRNINNLSNIYNHSIISLDNLLQYLFFQNNIPRNSKPFHPIPK